MNGTIVDIEGITINVMTIYGEHTTDKSYVLTIKDNQGKEIILSISYGTITDETIRCNKH